MRRRSRAESSHSEENYASYSYKDRAFKSGQLQDVEVCIKVFLFQGITSARVQHLREALASQGQISLDGRGKHKNRSLKLSCVYFYLCLANQRFAITHWQTWMINIDIVISFSNQSDSYVQTESIYQNKNLFLKHNCFIEQ